MKLATLWVGDRTTAAVLSSDGRAFRRLPFSDVGVILVDPSWQGAARDALAAADGPNTEAIPAVDARLAPLLPAAGKVICCGLNYSDHIEEMDRALPEYSTLFAKFADTLAGAADTIEIQGSDRVDWEAELAVVVGSPLIRASEEEAATAIAGYTVANDISMRDWQNRTLQWFQGKAFNATAPIGPVMVTPDETEVPFDVRGYVNGEMVQVGNTSTLVFGPAKLLSYISHFTTIRPGDLVLTGTPGGLGMGMPPTVSSGRRCADHRGVRHRSSAKHPADPFRRTRCVRERVRFDNHNHQGVRTMITTTTAYLTEGDNSKYAGADGKVVPVVTRAGEEDTNTAQSGDCIRVSGVSIQHTPATKIWFGQVSNTPGYRSLPHHHGEAETGGYVLRGHGRIYYGENYSEYQDMKAGDWVFVPPFMPHVEANMSVTEELVWLTTRTPENIVVNLEDVDDAALVDYRRA